MHAFRALQVSNDLEQFGRSRVPVRAKHLMKRLRVDVRLNGQLGKAHRRIYVVAQKFLTEGHFARQKAFDGFTKKSFAKCWIALRTRLYCFPKISPQCHFYSPFFWILPRLWSSQ